MKEKEFFIKRSDLKKVISTELGSAIVSDAIMVDGKPVGHMERIEGLDSHPDFSGWTFIAGDESQDYLDSPFNSGIYNLNTVANYDERIVGHLEAAVGTSIDL